MLSIGYIENNAARISQMSEKLQVNGRKLRPPTKSLAIYLFTYSYYFQSFLWPRREKVWKNKQNSRFTPCRVMFFFLLSFCCVISDFFCTCVFVCDFFPFKPKHVLKREEKPFVSLENSSLFLKLKRYLFSWVLSPGLA